MKKAKICCYCHKNLSMITLSPICVDLMYFWKLRNSVSLQLKRVFHQIFLDIRIYNDFLIFFRRSIYGLGLRHSEATTSNQWWKFRQFQCGKFFSYFFLFCVSVSAKVIARMVNSSFLPIAARTDASTISSSLGSSGRDWGRSRKCGCPFPFGVSGIGQWPNSNVSIATGFCSGSRVQYRQPSASRKHSSSRSASASTWGHKQFVSASRPQRFPAKQ